MYICICHYTNIALFGGDQQQRSIVMIMVEWKYGCTRSNMDSEEKVQMILGLAAEWKKYQENSVFVAKHSQYFYCFIRVTVNFLIMSIRYNWSTEYYIIMDVIHQLMNMLKKLIDVIFAFLI